MKQKMLSYKEYELIANRILFSTYEKSLAGRIAKDPDTFNEIVLILMMADWQWDGRGTIYGYRKQRVSWRVKRMIKDLKKNKGQYKIHNFSEFANLNFVDDTANNSSNEIDSEDYTDYIKLKINQSQILTDQEKTILLERIINGKTIREISNKVGIHVHNTRESFKKAISKIGKSLCRY